MLVSYETSIHLYDGNKKAIKIIFVCELIKSSDFSFTSMGGTMCHRSIPLGTNPVGSVPHTYHWNGMNHVSGTVHVDHYGSSWSLWSERATYA